MTPLVVERGSGAARRSAVRLGGSPLWPVLRVSVSGWSVRHLDLVGAMAYEFRAILRTDEPVLADGLLPEVSADGSSFLLERGQSLVMRFSATGLALYC